MRWLLAIVAIIVLDGSAHARMKIIREPALAMACPSATSWTAVLDCLKKHNLAATIVSTLDGAKLLSVQDATTNNHVILAFGLYTQKGTSWILGGLLEQSGAADELELVRFERVVGVKSGYRFDVAVTQASAISLDNVTAVPSVSRILRATFCAGTTYRCLTLVPQCSSMVFGQTVQLFDGTLAIHGGNVSLVGAGTLPSCSGSGDYNLNF